MTVVAVLVALVVPLVLVGAVVFAIVRVTRGDDREDASGVEIKHVLAALLAFVLYLVALVGTSMLLGLVLARRDTLGFSGNSEVAGALALTIVSVPSFLALWRYLVRRVDGHDEFRDSALWGLVVGGLNMAALFGAMVSLGLSADRLVGGGDGSGRVYGYAIVFSAAAVWSWRLLDGRRGPGQLHSLAIIGGSTLGVWALVGGLTAFVAILGAAAYASLFETVVFDGDVGRSLARSLVWVVIGGVVWTWYWIRGGMDLRRSTLRNVYVFLVAILPAVVVALSISTRLLYLVVSWLTGVTDGATAVEHFDGTFPALGVLGVAAVVWAYHKSVVTNDPAMAEGDTGRVYRYLLSGIAVIALGIGVGLVVRVVLGLFATAPIVSDQTDAELLVAGLVSIAVAAPVWWRAWSPLASQKTESEIVAAPRRIYLTVLAGVGGVIAVVTAIVFVFRLVEGALDGDQVGVIVGSVRNALGVLIATGLVAGYHISVWRRERHIIASASGSEAMVVTVAAPESSGAAAALQAEGFVVRKLVLAERPDDPPIDPAAVLAAVRQTNHPRTMVVVADGDITILPMA